jgi:hypothetical protein
MVPAKQPERARPSHTLGTSAIPIERSNLYANKPPAGGAHRLDVRVAHPSLAGFAITEVIAAAANGLEYGRQVSENT